MHIWRRTNTGTLGLGNMNHAVFQIQWLPGNLTDSRINLVYTCDAIRNPQRLPTMNNATGLPVPGLPNNPVFTNGTGLSIMNSIVTINGVLGVVWLRLNKDIENGVGAKIVGILQGTDSGAGDFSQFCGQFDHSFEQCFYLSARSLQKSHETAKQAALQLKKIDLEHLLGTGQFKSRIGIDTDFDANDLAQRLRNLGFS